MANHTLSLYTESPRSDLVYNLDEGGTLGHAGQETPWWQVTWKHSFIKFHILIKLSLIFNWLLTYYVLLTGCSKARWPKAGVGRSLHDHQRDRSQGFVHHFIQLFKNPIQIRFHFFGPKQLSLCSSCFRAQKSLDFHGPTLPMTHVMDLPPSNTLHTGAI